jgi:hypothetical protein
MYKSPLNVFYETALPDYVAYEESKVNNVGGQHNDLRLALHAANGLFHLADHVFIAFEGKAQIIGATKLGQYQEFLIRKCSDFALMRDCANAHKHSELTKGSPAFSRADCMREVFVMTEYTDEKGLYRIATKEIQVTLSDGTVRKMEDLLLNVVNMWYEELHRLGLLAEKLKKEPVPFVIPTRQASGESAPFNLTARQGLDSEYNQQGSAAGRKYLDPHPCY